MLSINKTFKYDQAEEFFYLENNENKFYTHKNSIPHIFFDYDELSYSPSAALVALGSKMYRNIISKNDNLNYAEYIEDIVSNLENYIFAMDDIKLDLQLINIPNDLIISKALYCIEDKNIIAKLFENNFNKLTGYKKYKHKLNLFLRIYKYHLCYGYTKANNKYNNIAKIDLIKLEDKLIKYLRKLDNNIEYINIILNNNIIYLKYTDTHKNNTIEVTL